jgi:hypothetical protein
MGLSYSRIWFHLETRCLVDGSFAKEYAKRAATRMSSTCFGEMLAFTNALLQYGYGDFLCTWRMIQANQAGSRQHLFFDISATSTGRVNTWIWDADS